MKILKTLVVITVISVSFSIFTPCKASSIKKFNNNYSLGIPDSLMIVFKRACMDCHSDGGNVMAESKVNFTKWNDYDVNKQINKANKICDILTEEKMPPKSWKKNNEKSIPTKKEIEAICKWTKTINTTK